MQSCASLVSRAVPSGRYRAGTVGLRGSGTGEDAKQLSHTNTQSRGNGGKG